MPVYYLRTGDYYEVKIYLFLIIHIVYQINTSDKEVLKVRLLTNSVYRLLTENRFYCIFRCLGTLISAKIF